MEKDKRRELQALLKLWYVVYDYYEKTGSKKELLIGAEENLVSFMEKEKEISFNQGYESKMSKYHKEYYKKNKEKMNQRSREYYQKNKALLKLKKWQKANKLSGK